MHLETSRRKLARSSFFNLVARMMYIDAMEETGQGHRLKRQRLVLQRLQRLSPTSLQWLAKYASTRFEPNKIVSAIYRIVHTHNPYVEHDCGYRDASGSYPCLIWLARRTDGLFAAGLPIEGRAPWREATNRYPMDKYKQWADDH